MTLINKKLMSLSLLMVLTTSLTAHSGEQPPNKTFSNVKTVKMSKVTKKVSFAKKPVNKLKVTTSNFSDATQVCAIEDNGQDWSKLQQQLKTQ